MVSISETEKNSLTLEIESLEVSASNHLKSSNDALFNVHRNHLAEVRCFSSPSPQIIEIVKIVAYLLGHNDSGDWGSIRNYLADVHILTKLTKLHEEFIMTDEIKEIVYPILYESGFDVNYLMRYSVAISNLYLWADNFFKYTEEIRCLVRLKKNLSDIERN